MTTVSFYCSKSHETQRLTGIKNDVKYIGPRDGYLPITHKFVQIKCTWVAHPSRPKRGLSVPNRSIHNYLRSLASD